MLSKISIELNILVTFFSIYFAIIFLIFFYVFALTAHWVSSVLSLLTRSNQIYFIDTTIFNSQFVNTRKNIISFLIIFCIRRKKYIYLGDNTEQSQTADVASRRACERIKAKWCLTIVLWVLCCSDRIVVLVWSPENEKRREEKKIYVSRELYVWSLGLVLLGYLNTQAIFSSHSASSHDRSKRQEREKSSEVKNSLVAHSRVFFIYFFLVVYRCWMRRN